MTSWILTDDTNELIARSVTRSAVARDKSNPVNFRAILDSPVQPDSHLFDPSALEGSVEPLPLLEDEIIDSYLMDDDDGPVLSIKNTEEIPHEERFKSLREEISKAKGQPVRIDLNPSDVLGFAFVKTNSEGHQERCKITECDPDSQQVTLEFLQGSKECMAYNDLINIINAQAEDGNQLWSFKGIKGHRKKNKKWEVLVDWDHTNESWEPLTKMRLADSVSLAEYAIKNKLFYQPGWNWAKKKNKSAKKYARMAKIFKSQVKDLKARFKFGVEVPRSVSEAMRLDSKNGNNKWVEAINKEKINSLILISLRCLKRVKKSRKAIKEFPGFMYLMLSTTCGEKLDSWQEGI